MLLSNFIPTVPSSTTNKLRNSTNQRVPTSAPLSFGTAIRKDVLSQKNTEVMCAEMLKKDGMLLAHVKYQTPRLYLVAVQQNWNALQFCDWKHPKMTEMIARDIICMAVRNNLAAVKYIPQTEEYHLMALDANPFTYPYFTLPSEKVSIRAITLAPQILPHIVAPTSQIYLALINARILNYQRQSQRQFQMDAPEYFTDIPLTSEILSGSLDISGGTIFPFIPVEHRCGDIAEKAVRLNPKNLAYVKEEHQTSEMCDYAVARAHSMLGYAKKISKAAITTLVTRHPNALAYLPESDTELAVAAVRAFPSSIQYVRKQVYDVWTRAGAPFDGRQPILRFLSNIRRRARRAPASLGTVEDPITLDTVASGTLCGFLQGGMKGTWHLAGTLDSILELVHNRFRDSTLQSVFVPHRNALVEIREFTWFIVQ